MSIVGKDYAIVPVYLWFANYFISLWICIIFVGFYFL